MVPVRLTPEEIDRVVKEVFPDYRPIRDAKTLEVAVERDREILRGQLENVKLLPGQLDNLIELLFEKTIRSVADSGMAIGSILAALVGQTLAQVVLNSFHSAGSGQDITGGLKAIKQVISGSSGAVLPAMIYFKNPDLLTRLDVFRYKAYLEEVTLTSIARKFEFLDIEEVEDAPWRDLYFAIRSKPSFESSEVFRVYLDMNELYRHMVTMEEIVTSIEASNMYLRCCPSPWNIEDPFVDVYVNTAALRNGVMETLKMEIQDTSRQYFFTTFTQQPIHIKGIWGVEEVSPISFELYQHVLDAKPLSATRYTLREDKGKKTKGAKVKDASEYWVMILDQENNHRMGISDAKYRAWFEYCGMKVHQHEEDVWIVSMKGGMPLQLMQKTLQKAYEEQDELYRAWMKGDRQNPIPDSPEGLRKGLHWFARATTTRPANSPKDRSYRVMGNLSRIGFIDLQRTTSGDMYELIENMGVNAFQHYLTKVLQVLITNAGGQMTLENARLMALYVCLKGYLTPFTPKGATSGGDLTTDIMGGKNEFARILSGASEGTKGAKNSLALTMFGGQARVGTYTSDVLLDTSALQAMKQGASVQEVASMVRENRQEDAGSSKGSSKGPQGEAPKPEKRRRRRRKDKEPEDEDLARGLGLL